MLVELVKRIQKEVDKFAVYVAKITGNFIKTKAGQWFLALSLVGPFTFLPTVWAAWTAPNIDALRTFTWPMMVVVNTSVLISVCHNGDWRVRLSLILWIILMALTWIATIVR
jgi:hypothetical protein